MVHGQHGQHGYESERFMLSIVCHSNRRLKTSQTDLLSLLILSKLQVIKPVLPLVIKFKVK